MLGAKVTTRRQQCALSPQAMSLASGAFASAVVPSVATLFGREDFGMGKERDEVLASHSESFLIRHRQLELLVSYPCKLRLKLLFHPLLQTIA